MTLSDWLTCALTDVERRRIPELRPLLEALAHSTASLRKAPWNTDASGRDDARSDPADAR